MLLPFPWTRHHGAGTALKQLDFAAGIELLPVAFEQQRLVVEGVALTRRARHEQLNHALGSRRMIEALALIRAQKLRQGQSAQPSAIAPKKISTIHSSVHKYKLIQVHQHPA